MSELREDMTAHDEPSVTDDPPHATHAPRRASLTPAIRAAANLSFRGGGGGRGMPARGGSFTELPAQTIEKKLGSRLRFLVVVICWIVQHLVITPAKFFARIIQRYTERVYHKRQLRRLRSIMDATEDHATWDETAKALDLLQGYDEWKVKNIVLTLKFVHPRFLINETRIIAKLFEAGCDRTVASYIKTALHRDLYGITQPPNYRYYRGTKVFVQDYISAVTQLIEAFAAGGEYRGGAPEGRTPAQSSPPSASFPTASHQPQPRPVPRTDLRTFAAQPLDDDTGEQLRFLVALAEKSAVGASGSGQCSLSIEQRIATLEDASKSFGRCALLLSGGAALGMYHAGTVRALWNEGLLPRIMSGSSAGAIIASIFCTRTDSEINQLCKGTAGNLLNGLTLDAFELQSNMLATGALMDVKQLMRCLQSNVGDATFLEAYQRTGRVLNVSIAAFGREGEKSMVLNYITSPNVIIWTGVAASCAMPGLFGAVQLMKRAPDGTIERHLPGQLWFDGSVPCDLPKQRLAELFNCNYFIVSQTNPHVVPFLPKPPSNLVNKQKSQVLKSAWSSFCSESKYWLLKLYRFGLLPRSGGWEVPYLMAKQTYTGDVTIRPIGSVWRAIPDFINLTSNPTPEHIEYVVASAQRQTWPHLLQIQYATEIERCLDRALAALHAQRDGGKKAACSSSSVDDQ